MSIKLVVLDFDGTLTDVDKEASSYIEGHKQVLANAMGIDHDDLEKRWEKAQKKVDKDHSLHGRKVNGRIVAPAYADPYIKAGAISEILLDEAGLYTDEAERLKLLDDIFMKNYRKTPTVFKEDAEEFLSKVKRLFDVCIVTNSSNEDVLRKLGQMKGDHKDVKVHGGARKTIVTDEWGTMPHSIDIPELDRPILLRRQKYWNLLCRLMKEKGIGPENVAVVGDVYELDLALPQQQGMHIILTPRKSTPDFEKDLVSSYPIGFVAKDLDEAYEWLTR